MAHARHTSARGYSRGTLLRRGATAAGALALAAHGSDKVVGAASATPRQEHGDAPSPLGAGATPTALAAAHLAFGLRVQRALVAEQGLRQNLFFSPLSVALALTMAYNGATGPTQQAMAATLGLQGLRLPDINHASQALIADLQTRDPHVALHLANALWLRRGLVLVPGFAADLRTFFGAPPRSLDFASPTAPAVINAWVQAETRGLIPSIVDKIDPTTMMYLMNALYFKAAWSMPFKATATQPGVFTAAGGRQISLPMMAQSGTFLHAMTAAYEAIRLPYAAGQISMYIVLPSVGSSLRAFVGTLLPANWTALIAALQPSHGALRMPRFTVDFGASLKAPLSSLGMGLAFDPNRATFTAMLRPQRAFISDVQHRAIMKVDEAGTLAAAVTSVGIGITAVQRDAFTMVVNRPFLCAIRDDVTGTLLFLGAIVNPR